MSQRDESGALGPEGSYYEQRERQSKRRMDGLYPIFITVLYLILGFAFHLWHPGWLIFLTIPTYYWQERTPLLRLCNPVVITLVYLILGFYFHLWHPGWLVFFAIPVAYIVSGKQSRQSS